MNGLRDGLSLFDCISPALSFETHPRPFTHGYSLPSPFFFIPSPARDSSPPFVNPNLAMSVCVWFSVKVMWSVDVWEGGKCRWDNFT